MQSAGAETGVDNDNAAACAMVSLVMVMLMVSSMAMSSWVSIVVCAAVSVAICRSHVGHVLVSRRQYGPTTTSASCVSNGGVRGVQF